MIKERNPETLVSSYDYYKENAEKKMPLRAYTGLIKLFMQFIMAKVLEGKCVRLPQMGTLYLRGKKDRPRIDEEGRIKGLSIDYNATRIARREDPLAPVVYHFNEHTGGVSFTIFWCKMKMYVENKDLYSFTPTRNTKRASAKLIKSHAIEFEVSR